MPKSQLSFWKYLLTNPQKKSDESPWFYSEKEAIDRLKRYLVAEHKTAKSDFPTHPTFVETIISAIWVISGLLGMALLFVFLIYVGLFSVVLSVAVFYYTITLNWAGLGNWLYNAITTPASSLIPLDTPSYACLGIIPANTCSIFLDAPFLFTFFSFGILVFALLLICKTFLFLRDRRSERARQIAKSIEIIEAAYHSRELKK